MCMKYEELYRGLCWDYMFGLYPEEDPDTIKTLLRELYGVEIVNNAEFERRLIEMFEKMHEDGIIQPKKDEAA